MRYVVVESTKNAINEEQDEMNHNPQRRIDKRYNQRKKKEKRQRRRKNNNKKKF